MQKSVAKIEAIFGFRFFFAGLVPWHRVQGTRWPLLVLRHYIQLLLAHTNKEEWTELPPGNWTTDKLWYVCFWDSRGTQGGYWNWSAILEMFCEGDCGVGILCNGLLQALILVFGCSAWVWYFLAILLSAKQSGSCCWRPGLFELSHGTLARIWGFWILPSLTHSSRLYFLGLELRLSFCMAPLFQSSADVCYSWWPEPFELSLEWCLHYFWWFELFWFFALIRGAQFLATFYFW